MVDILNEVANYINKPDLFQEKILGKYQLLEKIQQLADADALKLQNDLEQAINKNPKKIIVLTHVPPFKEACLHEGEIRFSIIYVPFKEDCDVKKATFSNLQLAEL